MVASDVPNLFLSLPRALYNFFGNCKRQSNIVDDAFCRGKRLQLGYGIASGIKLVSDNEATEEVQKTRCQLIREISKGQIACDTRDLYKIT